MVPLSPPESYVVRIYRRDARVSTRVMGTVEVVGRDGERAFKSLHELQRILAGTAGGYPERKP
jgi:hypothetical protein